MRVKTAIGFEFLGVIVHFSMQFHDGWQIRRSWTTWTGETQGINSAPWLVEWRQSALGISHRGFPGSERFPS